jgi:hypothetical protein
VPVAADAVPRGEIGADSRSAAPSARPSRPSAQRRVRDIDWQDRARRPASARLTSGP